MPTPTKRIALFFDGTDNTPRDQTNVYRAFNLLADTDKNGVPQFKKYIEGVGTDSGGIVLGSIFGEGVAIKIREGYEWLVQNYADNAEIYIFGFSRGAFTTRGLVQMIASCGLTRSEALGEWSVERAFDRYEAISRGEEQAIWHLRYLGRHPDAVATGWSPDDVDQILLDDTKVREAKVRLAGVWDTVGAIGTDALDNKGADTEKSASYNVRPTKAQEYGYHAMAIDEHRPMFDVTLWRTFVVQGQGAETMARYTPYYEQRWFIGAHADVGGGYQDNRLPDITLSWMLGKAMGLGLAFTDYVVPQVDGWKAPPHDSYSQFAGGILNFWGEVVSGLERMNRQIGRSPRTVTTMTGTPGELWSINESIDDTVIRRWLADPAYRPPSLVDYFTRNPKLKPQ